MHWSPPFSVGSLHIKQWPGLVSNVSSGAADFRPRQKAVNHDSASPQGLLCARPSSILSPQIWLNPTTPTAIPQPLSPTWRQFTWGVPKTDGSAQVIATPAP